MKLADLVVAFFSICNRTRNGCCQCETCSCSWQLFYQESQISILYSWANFCMSKRKLTECLIASEIIADMIQPCSINSDDYFVLGPQHGLRHFSIFRWISLWQTRRKFTIAAISLPIAGTNCHLCFKQEMRVNTLQSFLSLDLFHIYI